MTAKQIIKRLPKFAAIFDGSSTENTLTFYYKKNKATDIYELIDEEAEEEVAELMGVKIKTFRDTAEEEAEMKPLDEEQIEKFKTHMADIKTGIAWLNSK